MPCRDYRRRVPAVNRSRRGPSAPQRLSPFCLERAEPASGAPVRGPCNGPGRGLLIWGIGDHALERGMTEADSHLSRRAVIKGASLGVGISLMGPAPVEPAPAPIWSGEYRARKGDVSLYLFRKRQGAPTAGAPPRPVLFLVHGSSISARPSFDLAVPGHGEYSLMNTFAGYGFDVWTLDHEG